MAGLSPAVTGTYLNNLVRELRNRNTIQSPDDLTGLAAQLLAALNNPQNVSILTAELLSSPALWERSLAQETVFQVSHRIVGLFAYAAGRRRAGPPDLVDLPGTYLPMSCQAFAKAVTQGLRDQWNQNPRLGPSAPSRYKDLMVLAGLLTGFENKPDEPPAPIERGFIENGLQAPALRIAREFAASNLEPPEWNPAVVFAMTIVFPTLSIPYQGGLPSDALLASAMQALAGVDGLDDGRVLAMIDHGITQNGAVFDWPNTSSSFLDFQKHQQKPFVMHLGALAKVIGYAIRTAKDVRLVLKTLDDLVALSANILLHWRMNKLSTLDVALEAVALTPRTLNSTWASLWTLFKGTLWSVVTILTDVITRALVDRGLGTRENSVIVATKALMVLRNLTFISSHKGSDAFEGYQYVRLAALDKLSTAPEAIAHFLQKTKPIAMRVAANPVEAALDLFYLTTAEHLPLSLDPRLRESLIIDPARAYLHPTGPLSTPMQRLFEAANAAVLAVVSCPGNDQVTAPLVPFYIDSLLRAFPIHMSPRQFRLAFKTLIKVLSRPNAMLQSHFSLCETVMELAHQRVLLAAEAPLAPLPGDNAELVLSEKATLILAMTDALPFLAESFEDWLTTTAIALNSIQDPTMRNVAKERFCGLATGGEWDPWQVPVFLAWWTSKGGVQAVLYGSGPLMAPEPLMSGALVGNSGTNHARL
ncbi:hypothetical protein GQ53DRAFT_744408 [Thozetella sp. PMI_491]|nr:hypothetical protein GQ53DRAFT_744408 [Thozetella sp. PMI_491]